MKIGIAGAGLMGRLLSWYFAREGHRVSVFDRDVSGKSSAAFVAGGMLSPYSEVLSHSNEFFPMARQAMNAWDVLLPQFDDQSWFYATGSIVLSHDNDVSELQQFKKHVLHKTHLENITPMSSDIEQELNLNRGFVFEREGYIDTGAFLRHLLECSGKIKLYNGMNIVGVQPNCIQIEGQLNRYYDWVFDCRGFGGNEHYPQLRLVRGEIISLFAPLVNITRPIRLLHPRYRVYIVPRPNNHYLIGASEIEADDLSPISVRSTLELLSSAYSVHSGFSEARIVATRCALRAALPNNLPHIVVRDGMTAVNGLYRHGYLLGPLLLQKITQGVFHYAGVV